MFDPHIHQGTGRCLALHIHHPIDIVRLPRGSADQLTRQITDSIDQHRGFALQKSFVAFAGNRALQLLHALLALTFDRIGHIVFQIVRARAFLRRIREAANPITLDLLEEIAEHLEIGFCFTRKAHDHGGTHGKVGHDLAIARQSRTNGFLALRAPHTRQHCIRPVLHRRIEIAHDAGMRRDHFQQTWRDAGAVQVEIADPRNARFAHQCFKQFRQRESIASITSIMRQVLRHQIDLPRPLYFQQLRLAHQLVQREGTVLPAHERDRAKRTAVITSFTDLEIAHVRRIAAEYPDAWMLQQLAADQTAFDQLRQQAIRLGCPEKEIDLGQRVDQLGFVAFDHAADRKHRATGAVLLQSCRRKDGINRLLLRGVDEAAGVHHHHFGVAEVGDQLAPVRHEIGQVPLRIHRVLVAPEGDQSELEHRGKVATRSASTQPDRCAARRALTNGDSA